MWDTCLEWRFERTKIHVRMARLKVEVANQGRDSINVSILRGSGCPPAPTDVSTVLHVTVENSRRNWNVNRFSIRCTVHLHILSKTHAWDLEIQFRACYYNRMCSDLTKIKDCWATMNLGPVTKGIFTSTLLHNMGKKLERSRSVIAHSCTVLDELLSVETCFTPATTYCSTIGTWADGLTLEKIVSVNTRNRAQLRTLEQNSLYNIGKGPRFTFALRVIPLYNSSY